MEAIYGTGRGGGDERSIDTGLPRSRTGSLQYGAKDTSAESASIATFSIPPPPPPPTYGNTQSIPVLADADNPFGEAVDSIMVQPSRRSREPSNASPAGKQAAMDDPFQMGARGGEEDDDDLMANESDDLFGAASEPMGPSKGLGEVTGGSGSAGQSQRKTTYALSFDDIFGSDQDPATEKEDDSVFAKDESVFAPQKPVQIPKPAQAGNLQASLAKILTESPSVGLFEEAAAGPASKRKEGGEIKSRGDDGGPSRGISKDVADDSDDLFSASAGAGTTAAEASALGGRPPPSVSGQLTSFAKEIAAKRGGPLAGGDLMTSILSESPSVGLFDDLDSRLEKPKPSPIRNATANEEKPTKPAPKPKPSLDSILGATTTTVTTTGGAKPAASPAASRPSIVRDPFAIARAMKNQDDSEDESSGGSFSSDDDFDSDSDSDPSPDPPAAPKEKAESPQKQPSPTDAGDNGGEAADAFAFAPQALPSAAPIETPKKLPETAPKPKQRTVSESENPFSGGASDIFGSSEPAQTDSKEKKAFEDLFGSGDGSAEDTSFGGSATAAAGGRSRAASGLFGEDSNPFSSSSAAGGGSIQGQTSGGSPFGSGDLFSSSASSLFATDSAGAPRTSEKKKKAKSIFDDFLGESSKGGGLFD